MTTYATSQGTGSNYALASADPFAPTSFSVMTWLRFSAVSAFRRTAISRSSYPGHAQFRINVNTSEQAELMVSLDGTNWLTAANPTTLAVDTWYLVIGVHDGTNAYCYVGDAVGSALTVGNVSASGALHSFSCGLTIGSDNQGGGNEFENGMIDMAALWTNRALNSGERSYCYGGLGADGDGINLDYLQNDPDANNPGEPEHYWKLDENGGPYVDSVGSWDLTASGTLNRVAGHIDESLLFSSGGGAGLYLPFGPGLVG